jgi:periplasmic protein TonB
MRQLALTRTRAADFYNERRVTFVEQQANTPGATPAKSLKNAIPCPAAVAPVPGTEKPGLGASNQALEEVYPAQAKRFGVQGPVNLRVEISETGCLQRVELARSSGSDDLDDAAMLWAERASYTPGEKDKKAVAGSFTFRVKFELQD